MKLIITGRLPSLNEYTLANRNNRFGGASMKRKAEAIITMAIIEQNLLPVKGKVSVDFVWYEKDMKRDPDNIAFAKKFVFDALVKNEIIKSDGWRGVKGFTDTFEIDKQQPRIEVIIKGVEEDV